jgi:hypothetical protein
VRLHEFGHLLDICVGEGLAGHTIARSQLQLQAFEASRAVI